MLRVQEEEDAGDQVTVRYSISHFKFFICHSQIQLGSATGRCLKNTSFGVR
jgi:hypothetical protein